MPPPKLTDEELAELERLAALGLSQEQIADWFGFSDDTLRRRITTDPEALRAYKTGRASAGEKVTKYLWQNIEKGDPASIFFYLKTQMGWREKSREDDTSPEDYARAAVAAIQAMKGKAYQGDSDD